MTVLAWMIAQSTETESEQLQLKENYNQRYFLVISRAVMTLKSANLKRQEFRVIDDCPESEGVKLSDCVGAGGRSFIR